MRTPTPLPIGKKIKLKVGYRDDHEEDVFKVIAHYEHFTILQNIYGTRKCITNAELYTRGLVDPPENWPRREVERVYI